MRGRTALVVSLLTACGGSAPAEREPEPELVTPSSSYSTPPSPDAGRAVDHSVDLQLRRCAEVTGPLPNIRETVTRFNHLPKPVDGPCFVAALPRPLRVVATFGVRSAQPATGRSSPRLFFMLPNVVVSAVPEGDGSKAIEMGEWVTPTRTLKGEFLLPVTETLLPSAPFDRVLRDESQTVCATCHREEMPHTSLSGAFVSAAFKPEPGWAVSLAELREFHDACTRTRDPSARCAMFHALFDFGPVERGAFADGVATMNP